MNAKCLFCGIITKKIPASIIYEDELTTAFLDIHPRAPGHTVVIPKKHYETILDLNRDEITLVFSAIQRVMTLLKRTLNPDGFTIGINQGEASGQVIPHLHIHIMPRWTSDGGGSIHSVVNNAGDKSIDEIFALISGAS